MSHSAHDVVIVGGGPGGYVAAIRAAQLGLSVALVERDALGGVCLNWGCIPTKALLHAADVLRDIRHAAELGVIVDEPRVDLDRLVGRSRAVAEQLSQGVGHLMRKHRIPVHRGHARLEGPDRVRVVLADGDEVLDAEAIVLATGAHPKSLPGIVADGEFVCTAQQAMTPKSLPAHLLVIGAGAIGIEFASFYADCGSTVTVVEVLPRILPTEDEDVSAFARSQLEARGITIHTDAKVTALEPGRARVETPTGELDLVVDRVVLAVGVAGNIDDIGLEGTEVKIHGGFVARNAFGQTNEPSIYAIGDVAGPPCLAHKASHEGMIAMEHVAGNLVHPLARSRIPACTYAHPQVASVGLTERAAIEAGRQVRIGRFPLIGNGKAVALGDTAGLIKTVFDRGTGELLGAHLVGPGVTELVQGYAIAMGCEATEAELMNTVFPHPTLSEAMQEAVLSAYDRALHV